MTKTIKNIQTQTLKTSFQISSQFDFNTSDISGSQLKNLETDCLLIPILSQAQNTKSKNKNNLTNLLNNFPSDSQKYLEKIIADSQDNFKNSGDTLLIHHTPGFTKTKKLILTKFVVNQDELVTSQDFRKAVQNTIQVIKSLKFSKPTKIHTLLHTVPVDSTKLNLDPLTWAIQQTGFLFAEHIYQFNFFKTGGEKSTQTKTLYFLPSPTTKSTANLKNIINTLKSIVHGQVLTRNLSNLPANICTPTYLGEAAKKLGQQFKKIQVTVLNQKQIESLKMGALLGVAQGSVEPPKFIVLKYTHPKTSKKNQAPYVFVGKGITFDTGGNSLKPAASMVGMKYDMCGAATVLGVLHAAAALDLPLNIIGLIPTAENMPGGSAQRPNDVVTSMSGQTIEVLNTDAEGRLILADALTYAERFKPNTVIDIATLTGACVVALGKYATGLFTSHAALSSKLVQAGETSHDRVWPMPLWEDYQSQLDSPIADMANIGGSEAGSVTAACFLARFTKKYTWAHLDIAGTGVHFLNPKVGATGRPVGLLMQYLLNELNS